MIIFFVFLLGLGVGSFVNAWVYRIHAQKGILMERSECPHCHRQLAVLDLIPVVSFFLLNGRCRFCHRSISWHYPVVELIVAALFVMVTMHHFSLSPGLALQPRDLGLSQALFTVLRDYFVIAFFATLFICDLRYYILPDRVSLPGIVLVGGLNLWIGMPWTSLALGALIGGGFFAAQFFLSKGEWVGGGDIRLGVLMGVLLGPALTLVALFIAYIVGAIVGVALVLFKQKTLSSIVPFGTFLTGSTLVALLFGNVILQWYLSWL